MTAWGRIRSRAALTAAASSASAMTGSAPISFNGGAESGDRVSANTSCWFALRQRTRGRPIAPLAPAIRILIALPRSARFVATRELFDVLSFLEQVAREHGDACSSPCFVDVGLT